VKKIYKLHTVQISVSGAFFLLCYLNVVIVNSFVVNFVGEVKWLKIGLIIVKESLEILSLLKHIL